MSPFTYLGRLNTNFDVTYNHSVELGTSLAYTPSVRLIDVNNGSDRSLAGIDLTYRYQPLDSTVYQGFTWGSEIFGNSERRLRSYEDGTSVGKRRNALGGYS